MVKDTPARLIRAAASDLFADAAGVGIDLVDVRLMSALVQAGGQSFIEAYWTPAEQAATDREVERLAARWAAKEAVMKSLGSGVGEIDPIDIEIRAVSTGAPEVVLRGAAAEIAEKRKVATCHVSITHESSWAAAVALAVGAGAPPR